MAPEVSLVQPRVDLLLAQRVYRHAKVDVAPLVAAFPVGILGAATEIFHKELRLTKVDRGSAGQHHTRRPQQLQRLQRLQPGQALYVDNADNVNELNSEFAILRQ